MSSLRLDTINSVSKGYVREPLSRRTHSRHAARAPDSQQVIAQSRRACRWRQSCSRLYRVPL